MSQITAASERDIGSADRERLEDFALDAVVETRGGLRLQLAMVCDGVGGSSYGERASRLAAETIVKALERSRETDVPSALVRAIEAANEAVFDELQGRGNTTVALVAVNTHEQPFGRLFIASVGDSPIYLMRTDPGEETRLIRLNADHTVGQEAIWNGADPEEAAQLDNAHALTRAIGVAPLVEVDIGIYAEKGKDFVDPNRALQIGRKGILLRDGDTIFAASDGMLDINPDDDQPFVHEDEFKRHALDSDPQRTVRNLISYATSRSPLDNVSISMLFVPSERRKTVSVPTGLSQRGKAVAILSVVLALLVVAGLIILLGQSGQRLSTAEQTRVAQAATSTAVVGLVTQQAIATETQIANVQATQTAFVLSATWTPTPTPTVTPTFTPSPTLRPTVVPGQLGVQSYGLGQTGRPIVGRGREGAEVSSDWRPLLVELDGADLSIVEGMVLFVGENARFRVRNVDPRQGFRFVELELPSRGGKLFIAPKDFESALVALGDRGMSFESSGACFAANYSSPDEVIVSCYLAQDGCTLTVLPGINPRSLASGRRLRVGLSEDGGIDPNRVNEEAIDYAEASDYYRIVSQLAPGNRVLDECLAALADRDVDGVLDSEDICPDDAGQLWSAYPNSAGCPDPDGDGVPGVLRAMRALGDDRCPNQGRGPDGLTRDGCPIIPGVTPSATPSPAPTRATNTPEPGQPQQQPTSASAPTNLLPPPTRTPVPPTNTPVPPTNTPVPPTNTRSSCKINCDSHFQKSKL
ncbi:MAG: serine/threonine-protein phosphatase [Anaerolineae bacterium]|nr:serine/threonine-protein phosphatase [Anaerolineae bacterium]